MKVKYNSSIENKKKIYIITIYLVNFIIFVKIILCKYKKIFNVKFFISTYMVY